MIMRSFYEVAVVPLSVLAAVGVVAVAQQDQKDTPNMFLRDITTQRYAVSGRTSTLNAFFSLKADCSPMEWIEAFPTTAPEHGKIELVEGVTRPNYVASNPRTVCNGKDVKATLLNYTPFKEYVGPDVVEIELVDSGGAHVKYRFEMTVIRSLGK